MAPSKIMLIRHGEKPDDASNTGGVDEAGRADTSQLSVRGWQRAGALVRFFAPLTAPPLQGIAVPSHIFACVPRNGSFSLRPLSTVTPLARELGLTVHHEFGKDDIEGQCGALKTISGTALICWAHEPIPAIARGFAGALPSLPAKWPGKRFDLVWVLDRDGDDWRFTELGQMLLPDDLPV